MLDVALRLGRPPGLYQLDDLVLETQLAAGGRAGERLVELLAPLRERPELLATLRTLLAAKENRRQAATILHVHPNTLTYRLRRIAECSGYDPTEPAGLRVLAAAVIAQDLRGGAVAGGAEVGSAGADRVG